MIDFVYNTHDSHTEILKAQIAVSDTIVLCAAYWRANGLSKIRRVLIKAAKKEDVTIRIFVSLDEKITELPALEGLYKLSEKYRNIQVKTCWMQRYDAGPIFHPKVFYFRNGSEFTAVVGSANVTKNGLDNNSEASIRYTDSIGSEFDEKMLRYFEEVSTAAYAHDLDRPLIEEYRLWDRHKNRSKAG